MLQRLPFHVGLNTLNPLPHFQKGSIPPGGGGAYNPKIFANLPVNTNGKVWDSNLWVSILPSKSSEC